MKKIKNKNVKFFFSYLILGEFMLEIPENNYYTDYYIVKEGIMLEDFAKKYNIDNRLLSILNGLNKEDYLYPNQTILMPKNNMNYYITKDTDTLNDVNRIMNSNIIDLINQNNNIFLKEGQLIIYKEK